MSNSSEEASHYNVPTVNTQLNGMHSLIIHTQLRIHHSLKMYEAVSALLTLLNFSQTVKTTSLIDHTSFVVLYVNHGYVLSYQTMVPS